ncbi:MAG: hypothetical protein ABI016_16925 [Chthoniobacterales bacterium]
MLGLHAAVKHFAEAAGVGGQFQEDKEARAQKDAADADKAVGAEESWMQIRAAKIQTALENQSGTEEDAVAAGAPTGFGEAKWLMCPEQVMNVRPKAVATDSGNLSEAMEFLGRSANVEYDFKKGALARVIVTFQGSTGRSDFDQTQSLLQEAHGKMSAPSQTSEDLRSATIKAHFFIIHVLRSGNTEQVYFTE